MSKTILAIILALAAFWPLNMAEGADDSPNFIVFLTDDQGWGDLGCYGHPIIKSPNLDKFASEGLRLTQCYSACSVCSPSRSAILTGRTPYRNGVWRWIPDGSIYHLRDSEITITSLLKKRGYETCHAGKWHLNGKFNSVDQPQPDDHGYDHWLATQNNAAPNHMNPTNYVRNREEVGRMEGPSAVIAANEAIQWLKGRKDSETPFFISIWTHEPHLPIESAPQYMQHYAAIEDEGIRQHHGNITQLDDAFGKLMAAIDEMGYRDNTFIFFTSDNGPEGNGSNGRTRGSTGGLRGRKRATHEGGIRVPGIVRWPGKIKAGSVSETPVIGSDIFPTICDVLDIALPDDRTIDGTSLLPLFSGNAIQREQPLYWRNHLAPNKYRVGMRIGDWKIVGSDNLTSFELYNIKEDWQETTDVADDFPVTFAQLREALVRHDTAVLNEGPDWWKLDGQSKRVKRESVEPTVGEDPTGTFEVVLGTNITKTDFGYRMSPQSEGLAFQKLTSPIKDRANIRLKYRSAQKNGVTRNGALVLTSTPTNGASFKIGTAIGMNQHIAFAGDWGNIGNAGSQRATFAPDDTFEIAVSLDLSKRTGSAEINGVTLNFSLPRELKSIEYVGFYAKETSTEFSVPVIE